MGGLTVRPLGQGVPPGDLAYGTHLILGPALLGHSKSDQSLFSIFG